MGGAFLLHTHGMQNVCAFWFGWNNFISLYGVYIKYIWSVSAQTVLQFGWHAPFWTSGEPHADEMSKFAVWKERKEEH